MSSASFSTNTDGARRGPVVAMTDSVADLGAVTIRWVETLGDMTLFSLSTLSWLLTRRPRRGTLLTSLYNIGVLSLPVVALTGTFIGMVLAVQSYTQFKQFGFETRLGALINLSMCRELGPGAGGHDAGRPRRQRDRRRTGHDADHRADRRPGQHGRQPGSVPGRAAVPRAAC